MPTSQFLSTRLILPVRDVYESTEWYSRVLGMTLVYIHGAQVRGEGEPANFASMTRDAVELHFILDEGGPIWTRAGSGNLNLIVQDVDEVYGAVRALGAEVTHDVQEQNWGARGFRLCDPSGNEILIEQTAG